MSEICITCGLPQELCVCETIAKESQKIIVRLVKKKFNKISTVVEGIQSKEINLKELATDLKSKLACGGTAKEGRIELQGDHIQKVKQALVALGFGPETIEVQ
ncbi:translation initiation factor [Candidatus Woesearchaeota archaeon]|nr:translation initiation factor [Candidatus Woesearchaeota archaeon]